MAIYKNNKNWLQEAEIISKYQSNNIEIKQKPNKRMIILTFILQL